MKMEIIGALLHEPDVLFLDEPTIGLDVVAQNAIRQFLTSYVKEKRPTVILTSHYMDDIAKLADRLLLISRGGIVYDGTVPGFIGKTENTQQICFRYDSPLERDLVINAEEVLKKGEQEFQFRIPTKQLSEVVKTITSFGTVHDLKIEEADFEEVIRKFLETESRVQPARNTH
jgi:ABC-2 type transport system ATP-binding protein